MKKKSFYLLIITFFSMILFLSSCDKIVEGFDFLDYSIEANENEQVVNLEKDEGMVIDGILDEYEWVIAKKNSYSVVNASIEDVRLDSMCYLGEKGVYFAVIVDDFAVYYNEERRTSRNTSVEVHFKGFGDLDTKAHCIRIIPTGDGVKVDMKDSSWRLNLNGLGAMQWMTSPFAWQGAAYIKGNMNTSLCEGYVCEAFVPWEVLGVSNHKYIRTYTAFNHVETASLDGDRIWTGTAGCLLTKPNTWKIVSNDGLLNLDDIMADLIDQDDNMVIDGKLDESIWAELDVAEFNYKTKAFADVSLSATSYMTEKGAYFGFVIKDKYIYCADLSARPIGLNSGMEILFAPYGVSEITPECLQLRITADNQIIGYSGVIGASYPWSNDNFNMLSATTIQDNNGEGGLNTSKNEGFTVELFIPWTSFNSTEKLDGVMVLPSVVHSENVTQTQKISPWDYCNVTNAKVDGQTNPQEHFIFMEETGAVLREFDVPNIFFTDEMYNSENDSYEYEFDVEAGFVKLNDKASSQKFKVKPKFTLPSNITLTSTKDDTYRAVVKRKDIESFKNGVNFKVDLNGNEENGKIYYADIAVDGNTSDLAYGRSYNTLTNVSENVIEQKVSTHFDEKGIFVGFDVKDAIIKNNTHVETFFTLGDEIKVGNTYQIRCYPFSDTYKTYVFQTPIPKGEENEGWAWAERTMESKLNVIVDSKLTDNGYQVEIFIPYETFDLTSAPEELRILPCVSYYKDNSMKVTSQYHNQSGVSNFYTWDISNYVTFNSKGYVPERINVQDIYLTSKDYEDGFYTGDIVCLDDQNNNYQINEILGDHKEFFNKDADGNFQLKVSEEKLSELLASPIQAIAEDGKTYEFSITLLSRKTASAYIDFQNGQIANSGSNDKLTVDAVKIENKSFASSANVNYTDGIDGDAKGAILTNYRKGSYANISGLDLRKNDFTVSTWLYIPETTTLSTGNSSYIFGTSNCDTCDDGFRITLRYTATGFSFNIRSAYSSTATLVVAPSMSFGQWHNVILVRDGNKLYLYVDNNMLIASAISYDTDFTSSVLNFGAYINETWNYHDGNIAFDNIAVYPTAIDSNGVESIYINKI